MTKQTIGWREWVVLPAFGMARVRAKVDTGARTSALHAARISRSVRAGREWVEFELDRDDVDSVVDRCSARVRDRRVVRSSSGQEEERYIVTTSVRLGRDEWPIELALTARHDMGYPMLLGRTAIRGRYLVDPSRSYLAGKTRRRLAKQ